MSDSTASRRAVLGAMALAALAPGVLASPASAAGRTPIAPPAGPMRLTRILRREMAGDAEVKVERSFLIRFIGESGGFSVIGKQEHCLVTSPPSLAMLAKLEQQRVETGMLPLELDGAGQIVGQPDASPIPSLGQAVDIALKRIAQAPATEQAEMRAFVRTLQQAVGGISSALPPDLFTPPAEAPAVEREVPLPDGSTGSISARFAGSISPQTGLLVSAERVVVTDAAGMVRHTREEWLLGPAA